MHGLARCGHDEVVEAALSGSFDSIAHAQLMRSVARRVSERHVLALVKQWLVTPVADSDGRGGWRRTTRAKDAKRGVSQGAPISPLLSNLYMRRFVLGWKVLGHQRRLDAYIVNYADDFVICCRRGNAQAAMAVMRTMMERLGLAVNESKSGIRRLPDESAEFLGHTMGRCYSRQTGRAYVGTRASKRSVRRATQAVSRLTARRGGGWEAESLVGRLNRMLTGWGRYYCLGPVTPAYRAVDAHVRHRLRRWLRKTHKCGGRATKRFPNEFLYDTLGLVRLEQTTRDLPWAKA